MNRGMVVGGLLLGLTIAAPARPAENPEVVRVLEDLLAVVGVSGYEEEVRESIQARLPSWARDRAEVDAIGNLIVTAGEGEPHLLFVAHMDETGYLITHIRDDGFLEVRKLGGFYDGLYLGQHVRVHTEGGPVPGVVALPSTHLQAGRTLPIAEYGEDDVLIDVGTESRRETDELGILLLDPVTIPKAAYHLAGTRMTGRSMDDRFGCAALLALAGRIRPGDWDGTLTLAWVVQEEVGLRGARALAAEMKPDFVFPVDSFVTSDSPLENKRIGHAPLGDGPVIRAFDHSNITPIGLVRSTLAFAGRKGIPLQHGSTGGGNDGSVFRNARSVVMPLSIPIRYSHSPVETIDTRDLTGLVDLLEAMIRDHSWGR